MTAHCQVYGTPPPGHTCIVGVCVPAAPAPTVRIRPDRHLPLLINAQWPPTTAETEPWPEYCEKHGTTYVVDAGDNPGFTGATIYWQRLACGCDQVDASGDTLEAVR